MFYIDELEGCFYAVFYRTISLFYNHSYRPYDYKNITGLMRIHLKSLVFNIRKLCLSEAER